jgi:endopeptidase La
MPFKLEQTTILELINTIGYNNLLEVIKINKINLSETILKLINEINDVFMPTKVSLFNISNNNEKDFYWRTPNNYISSDILQLTRELWIKKNSKDNSYYKIEGIFKNDILCVKIKTCYKVSNYLFEKKKEIIKELGNHDINKTFFIKFIKYDYIGNIYAMSIVEYINYILNLYKLYLQLIKSQLITIMKNFINNKIKLINLYNIVFLLLLGNKENIEIAAILINLLKEKKINSPNLFKLINKNLPYFMQIKIKKGTNNINDELNKIKNLSIEQIDYKKQLLTIKNLSNNIISLTLEKIEEMKSHNSEYYKQKCFVDHILRYPWSQNHNSHNFLYNNPLLNNNTSEYLKNIKLNLDKFTYGHIEAKDILLEIIAKWIINPSSSGRPLGFVGPPGVGKTLLAQSISKALNIPFAEITLGGQNDGELLHGHGYTYSGSQPGIIVRKMTEMGQDKCILYFDELDKTASKHGTTNEILNILIHLTDPNMNKSFQDRFFQGINFPLDKVIMIFSYNYAEKIDPILLDRITQINIKPYTINDKILIIKNFIIPEIKSDILIDLNIEDHIIQYIIENYTNEAGVREIKRKIEKIYMKLNLEVLTNEIKLNNYILTKDEVIRILLKPSNDITFIHNKPLVGIINGLYATNTGEGGIVPIQIFENFTFNKFEIKLTGKQGDVMKESVQCALTCAINYIKNNLLKYNINNFDQYFNNHFKNGFHVHTPATAISKDGPSAGCAFTCCFISRILNKLINNEIGITGEIELTGKITKIGGLSFKLIAAKNSGIKTVFIPLENKFDYDDIIQKNINLIDDNFKVILVDYLEDLIDIIFV